MGTFNKDLGEFQLDYEQMRLAADPAQTLLDFLEGTYSAAADKAGWDRANLDRRDSVAQTAVHL